MRIIKIKNNSGQPKTWAGKVVGDGYSYQIEPNELNSWSSSEDLIKDIVDGYAIVSNGDEDFTNISKGLDWLKGISEKFDSEGNLKTVASPRTGVRKTIVTHNFCDPTTWYEESVRVEGDGYGQVLETIDGYETYKSPDGYVNWIDTVHGKITAENTLSGYQVEVTVDGYSKTEDLDYTVNYQDGYVIFSEALNNSNEVKAKFSYENGSTFSIIPLAGKQLKVLYTEVQVTKSTHINPSRPISFQPWVYNPYDLPNKVPYGQPELYKSARDIINIGNGGEFVPRFGDMEEDVIILPFNYAAATPLQSSVGAEIRISIVGDQPLDGYFGTMTAYCLSEDEEQ